MHYLLRIILLLWTVRHKLISACDVYSIQDDLKYLNASCDIDDCTDRIEGWQNDSLTLYACHCGAKCVSFDTCCLDSIYNDVDKPNVIPTCITPLHNNYSYLMIDRCPTSDNVLESLCRGEWNGDGNDVLKVIPVISQVTDFTYKNYFCFMCHEEHTKYLSWILRIHYSGHDAPYIESKPTLTFDRFQDSWVVDVEDKNITGLPVNLTTAEPDTTELEKLCEPNVISSCSEEWPDDEMREKCQKYTAIKEVNVNSETPLGIQAVKYRNVHCALCNFEKLGDITCKKQRFYSFLGGYEPFSFTYFLDINRSDGDVVGKIQKCTDEYMWDPYAERCRKLSCALPGYQIKNGKCLPG